jgi:hypothetical protein
METNTLNKQRPSEPPPVHFTGEETDLKGGFRRSQETRREYMRRFDQLPVIQHLRELWEAKGLMVNDPAFLLVEVLGLYDERQNAKFSQIVKVLEASDRFNLDAVREIEQRLGDVQEMERSSATLAVHLDGTAQKAANLAEVLTEFVETVPQIQESVEDARRVLDSHTLRGFLLNTLSPLLGVLLGLILGRILWR